MSATKRKGPVFDPGLCRCCGTMKKCRLLNVEYESFGQKEPTERLVCATCVMRLREANTFRKQVVQCEEAFIQMKMSIATRQLVKHERKSPTRILINKHKWWSKQPAHTAKPTIVENSYICPFKCRHNNLLCYYCGGHFTDPIQLREHTMTQHQPKKFKVNDHKNMVKFDLTRIDCRLCQSKIEDLDTFKRHLVNVHGKKYYFETKDSVLPFKLVKDDMRCALCNVGVRGQPPVRDAPDAARGRHLPVRDLRQALQIRVQQRAAYRQCDVKLMSHPQKLKHLVEVHGEQPTTLPCTYCDKVNYPAPTATRFSTRDVI
ncbi:Zinc finger protein 26 [Operophtera brumata]|uniref:Zinc finger protein 26 n=1 Tax=Operophtera brumata TaxID=104452 RepID=A0A0L7LDT4_OPEBR|nr:Zinc finger protein 26 [Operophtera brumata]